MAIEVQGCRENVEVAIRPLYQDRYRENSFTQDSRTRLGKQGVLDVGGRYVEKDGPLEPEVGEQHLRRNFESKDKESVPFETRPITRVSNIIATEETVRGLMIVKADGMSFWTTAAEKPVWAS
jgi:hypothetical protein